MGLEDPKELTERTLPAEFRTIEETRWLISTTFFPRLFSGQARFIRYRARPTSPMGLDLFRTLARKPRPTLYDLQLMIGEEGGMTVYPALCLRPESEGLRFIHLTDLHVALRNDLYADNLKENITASLPPEKPTPSAGPKSAPSGQSADSGFNNFNENLRRFIGYANSLSAEGKLDLVLLTGDLVDFLRHGFQGGGRLRG
jgi:hypothetical protein